MLAAYLSEVERGLKDVSADLLIAIAYALSVPIGAVYADLGRRLSVSPQEEPAWPSDPRRSSAPSPQDSTPPPFGPSHSSAPSWP